MVDLKLLEIEALVKINLRDIKHLKKICIIYRRTNKRFI